jgi:type II restriction enzyme
MIVPVNLEGGVRSVNIPIDVVIKRKTDRIDDFPIFFEAKSAGDFTNTNKRRKEEAVKMAQLRSTYGKKVQFNLFLCGYFDSGYLGYEAAEGIDWVWEHRIDDLAEYGL